VVSQVLARSYLLQASWNFERLQSLGFLYAILPALRFLYRGEELRAACRRHLEYFNTHPFMASPVIGTALALEEGNVRGERSYLGMQDFRRMVMAPYAAMGDALFWGGIRPMAAGVAVLFALRGSLWAPVVFLILFNAPHLSFRVMGLLRGYAQGLKIVDMIQRRRLPDVAIRLKEGTVVLLGGVCAYLAFVTLRAEQVGAGWGVAIVPAILFLGRLARGGVSPLLLVFLISAFFLAVDRFF
jgi:PTS system mannose-specific IID component